MEQHQARQMFIKTIEIMALDKKMLKEHSIPFTINQFYSLPYSKRELIRVYCEVDKEYKNTSVEERLKMLENNS